MLGEIPLIEHIINSAKKSKFFDEIYINSEADELEKIAEKCKIKFYRRPNELSIDPSTNDDFTIDFIQNIECDILIQLLPTSPFISSGEINDFTEKMINGNYDTMISVSNIQIESLYFGKPINFNKLEKTPPSQDLEPIKAYACGIMGWKSNRFKMNMKKYNSGYHGGDGSIGYFELKGFSTIDIDNEEDFILAEAVLASKSRKKSEPRYFSLNEIADADREKILIEDGVRQNTMDQFNQEISKLQSIIDKNSSTESWSHTLINSPSNCVTLIAQMPGEGNRMHYHHNWDEWWYIIQGEWEWNVEGVPKSIRKDDVVFISRNKKHKITAKGDQMAIRLAVSREDVDHVYDLDSFKK